jgi:hypothetical protein
MATAKKTTKKSPEGAQENRTMTELLNQMMDPKHVMKLQREAVAAAFDGALEVHTQTRKMAEQAWSHSYGDLDEYAQPWRKAGQEMQAASFDLGQKALETSRKEMDRVYEMFSTAS